MRDKQYTLDFILLNDPLGVLQEKPKHTDNKTDDERLISSFGEITKFFDEHDRKPKKDDGIIEYTLACRLEGLAHAAEKIEKLRNYDKYQLLAEEVDMDTVDDILTKDPLGVLNFDYGEDIFKLKHVSPQKPDYVANRKKCKNFAKYEHLFKKCHADLVEGKRKKMKFRNEQDISAGEFFILNGITVYIANVGERQRRGDKTNARLHCIFENGMESNMLLRALATGLYKDKQGSRIYRTAISSEDKQSGFIYVLKSKSENPAIKDIQNLYKIGYTTMPIEERIKNAANEPTYLMAEVSIVASYKCFNLNTKKLEHLLHKLFSEVCLDLEITDAHGKPHVPREWFVVPLPVIKDVIEKIVDGTITDYRYNRDEQRIEKIL